MTPEEASSAGIAPEVVLSFWFPEGEITDGDPESGQRRIRWWFVEDPEVDREISERFGGVLERAPEAGS